MKLHLKEIGLLTLIGFTIMVAAKPPNQVDMPAPQDGYETAVTFIPAEIVPVEMDIVGPAKSYIVERHTLVFFLCGFVLMYLVVIFCHEDSGEAVAIVPTSAYVLVNKKHPAMCVA